MLPNVTKQNRKTMLVRPLRLKYTVRARREKMGNEKI